jgi:hypothetical protein
MYRGGTSRLTLNIGAQENADTTNTATMGARMVANPTCSDPTHNAEMRRGRHPQFVRHTGWWSAPAVLWRSTHFAQPLLEEPALGLVANEPERLPVRPPCVLASA